MYLGVTVGRQILLVDTMGRVWSLIYNVVFKDPQHLCSRYNTKH